MYQSLVALIYPFLLSSTFAVPTPQSNSWETPEPQTNSWETPKWNAPEWSSSDGSASGYKCFRGLDFPQSTNWRSFQELQDINYARLSQGNSPETVANILEGIQAVASEAGIDPRIVLAQIMQESQGQMSKAGDGGKSIGLMQVQMLNGEKGITCASYPCSREEIHGMIAQGVLGTTHGDGPMAPGTAFYLKQFDLGTSLRWYNTGSVPNPADLSVATPISTESYVSDVANRLQGLTPDAAYPDPACHFVLPFLS